jgi:hypothetical protein
VLWKANYYGPVFAATMTLARFRVLASNMRFDDELDRKGRGGRWQNDRFAAMRKAVQKFLITVPLWHFFKPTK